MLVSMDSDVIHQPTSASLTERGPHFIQCRLKRTRNLAVGAYFIPYITSSVAIALIFATLYTKDYGVINAALQALGFAGNIDWLGDAAYTKPAVAFVVFWRYLGWNVVLYLSALQVIDNDLYEAATLDGAGTWKQFWHITLPLLRPMIFFAVTLTLIGNLQLFEDLQGHGGQPITQGERPAAPRRRPDGAAQAGAPGAASAPREPTQRAAGPRARR